jgi:predicted Zn finger-like uncharacterized protein
MQIACPNCATTYQVDAYSIGVKGRPVRCARCKTVWFALPPSDPAYAVPQAEASGGDLAAFRNELGADAAAQAAPQDAAANADTVAAATGADAVQEPPAEAPPEPVAAEAQPPDAAAQSAPGDAPAPSLADIKIPTVEAPPLTPDAAPSEPIDNAPEDIERAAARRRAQQAARRRRASRRNAVPATILVLIMLIAALIAWRKDIVRWAPQMASLYAAVGLPVNLRGLIFQDVTIKNETHDGVPVLVVEGKIVSTAAMAVDVPRLRFALRNAAGAEIYSWTTVPSQPVLEPGGMLPFRGRLASPPADGVRVDIRFFTKRDAAGGR